MTSLSARRDRRRNRSFVGRVSYLERFREVVSANRPLYNVLMYWGVGGIGKTTLIKELKKAGNDLGLATGVADLETARGNVAVMKNWRDGLTGGQFDHFDRALEELHDLEGKIRKSKGKITETAVEGAKASGVMGTMLVHAIGEDRIKEFGSSFESSEIDAYLALEEKVSRRFVGAVNLISENKIVCLFLDTYENSTPLFDNWLRELLGSGIEERVLLCIAGREPLVDSNLGWADWKELVLEQHIDALTNEEFDDYLKVNEIEDPQVVEKIRELSGGHPWAIDLSIEFVKLEDTELSSTSMQSVGRQIVRRFLRQVQDVEVRRTIELCSIPSSFNEDIIRIISPSVDAARVLEQVDRYSFSELGEDGKWRIRRVVRNHLQDELARKSPSLLAEARSKLASHHWSGVETGELYSQTWSEAVVEWARHSIFVDKSSVLRFLTERSKDLRSRHLHAVSSELLRLCRSFDWEPAEGALVEYLNGRSLSDANLYKSAEASLLATFDAPEASVRLRCMSGAELLEVRHRLGKIDEAMQISEKGFKLASSDKSLAQYSALFAMRTSEFHGILGNASKLKEFAAKSEEKLEEIEDPWEMGVLKLLYAHTLLYRGEIVEGDKHLAAAKSSFEQANDLANTFLAQSSQAWSQGMRGYLLDGVKSCLSSYEYFIERGDLYHAAIAALNVGFIACEANAINDTKSWNRRAANLFQSIDANNYLTIAHYQLALDYAKSGDTEAAMGCFKETLNSGMADSYTQGLARLALVKGAAQSGTEASEAEVMEAISALEDSGSLVALVHSKLLRASDSRMVPEGEALRKDLDEALKIAKHNGMTALGVKCQIMLAFRDLSGDTSDFVGEVVCALDLAKDANPVLLYSSLVGLETKSLDLPDAIIEDLCEAVEQTGWYELLSERTGSTARPEKIEDFTLAVRSSAELYSKAVREECEHSKYWRET